VARTLASPRSLRPRPAVAVAVLVLAVVGAALGLAAATGSLGIPHNDDWSFSRTALTFAQTGQIRLYGWGQMFLIGQVVTTAPLLLITGPQQWALQSYGGLAAVLVLVCTYLLAGRGWRAVALVATVTAFPGFALWTASYMTDLPAAGAALLALVLAVRAARLSSIGWLVAALLAGFWAFTIRETMAGAIVAVVLVVVLPADRPRSGAVRRLGLIAVGGGAILMALAFALEGVRHGMANADAPPYRLSDLDLTLATNLVSAYFTVGLGVVPLVLWAAMRLRARDLRSVGRWIGWGFGLFGVAYVRLPLTLPNHLDQGGAYSDALAGGPVVGLPHPVWVATQVLAAIGGVGLAGEIGASWRVWRRIRAWDPARIAAVGFGLLLALVTAALTLTGQEQWDRYVLALIPCVGVALLPALRARPRAALAWLVPVLLMAAVSWSVAVTANVRDGQVWAAARRLVAQGVDPRMINAGLDWNGYHSDTPAMKDRGLPTYAYHGQRWTYIFPDNHDCWIVSLTPLPEVGETQPVGGVYIAHRPSC
jgi:hypothetical protein